VRPVLSYSRPLSSVSQRMSREILPVSSIGTRLLQPALMGWNNLVEGAVGPEFFYIAFLCWPLATSTRDTGIALLILVRGDWV